MIRVLRHGAFLGLLAVLLAAPHSSPALARATRVVSSAAVTTGQLSPSLAAPAGPLEPQIVGQSSESETAASPAESTDQIDYPNAFMSLPGGTTVIPEHFYSSLLDRNTWYEVVLPPGYAQGTQRYPVLYMLHGAMGGASEWLEVGLHKAADSLWSEGELPPFIVVLPDGGNSYWLNHANGGPDWGDHVAMEMVERIDANYRTLAGPQFRAVGGLSMGGDGALQLALHHPDVFGIVGAHSPTTRLEYEKRPGDFYGDFEYWLQNNPLWLIQNTDAAANLKIWIDMGRYDLWLPSSRALHEALLDRDVDHEYLELEGTHAAEYWEELQWDYLRFYGLAFAEASLQAAQPLAEATAD